MNRLNFFKSIVFGFAAQAISPIEKFDIFPLEPIPVVGSAMDQLNRLCAKEWGDEFDTALLKQIMDDYRSKGIII